MRLTVCALRHITVISNVRLEGYVALMEDKIFGKLGTENLKGRKKSLGRPSRRITIN
jgi:hypothetical protein